MQFPVPKRTDVRTEKGRKIALFGAFGVGNLGNECTLEALLHNIRKYVPNAQVICICSGPEAVRSTYHIPASLIKAFPLSPVRGRILRLLRQIFLSVPMEVFRWLKAIDTLRDVDMLIMTGTGMLSDFGIRPLGLHYEILKWTAVAKLCRRKVLFVSVGAGPIHHPVSRRFIKVALSCADYRSYRDQFSKDYVKTIGFDRERDQVYPDLAFSFPTAMVSPANHNGASPRAVIGVGLMTYFNKRSTPQADETVYRNYIAKMGDFVSRLIEQEYTVKLLIGDVVYDQRARQDLIAWLEQCPRRASNGNIIDDPPASVHDVFSQLAETDLVIASRFHNILVALMLAKPVLAISYHEKVDALMADAGLAEFCQDIEHIDLENLARQFGELEKQMSATKLRLQRDLEAHRTALDSQYDYIFNHYLN